MWSILENIPCEPEKKVYSSAFVWNVLKISMSYISSKVSFKVSDPEGWCGEGGGRRVQDGEHMYTN